MSLITRLRLDAALYDPVPLCAPGQNGQPRKKGAWRPTLQALLIDAHTPWTPLTVSAWCGGGAREVEVYTDTAVWYHAGLPSVPIRWVLIRDPQHGFPPQALVTTHLAHASLQVKKPAPHLGVETQRQ